MSFPLVHVTLRVLNGRRVKLYVKSHKKHLAAVRRAAANAAAAAARAAVAPGFPHYVFYTDEETREDSCDSSIEVLKFYKPRIDHHGHHGTQFYLDDLFEKHGSTAEYVAAGHPFFENLNYWYHEIGYKERCVLWLSMSMADRANDVIKMPSDDFGFPSTTLPTLFVPKKLTVYKFGDGASSPGAFMARPHMSTPRDVIVFQAFCEDVNDSLTVCFHEAGTPANAKQKFELRHLETIVLAGRAIREFRVSVPTRKRKNTVYLFKLIPDLCTDCKRKRD
jgi:hypothetical protein